MNKVFVIAVADSDEGVTGALSCALLAHGYEPLPVRSAVDLAAPAPDAVLLDRAMDVEVARRIEREWPNARIVYTTADLADAGVLQKPFSVDEALRAIFSASN